MYLMVNLAHTSYSLSIRIYDQVYLQSHLSLICMHVLERYCLKICIGVHGVKFNEAYTLTVTVREIGSKYAQIWTCMKNRVL